MDAETIREARERYGHLPLSKDGAARHGLALLRLIEAGDDR